MTDAEILEALRRIGEQLHEGCDCGCTDDSFDLLMEVVPVLQRRLGLA